MVLVSKAEVGDDRIFTYELAFGNRSMYYKVALAPNDMVSQFQLMQK